MSSGPPAVVYARVSSEGQADNTSLAEQEARARAFAESRGLSVAEVVTDVASGANLDRPGLAQLRAMLRPGDSVIVMKLDRLSRSIVDAEPLISEWEARGIGVHSVSEPLETSSAMGRAMFRMVLVFAQAEREVIAERVAAGKARNAAEAGFNGSPIPFGYRAGAEPGAAFVVEPAEAAIVRDVFQRFTTGRYAPARLQAMTGCPLTTAGIAQMLSNPTYTGRLRWRAVARRAEHPPIVSDRVFLKAQRERARRSRSAQILLWKKHGNAGEMVLCREQR